jgi:hypothetical protein
MILILILLKSTIAPNANSAIVEPQGNGTNRFETDPILFPDFRNTEWFIVSETDFSDRIESQIRHVLEVLRVFN